MENKRRSFIKTAMIGAISTSLYTPEGHSLLEPRIQSGATILFQGDSITDSSRKRSQEEANLPDGLGNGYAFLAAGKILNRHASKGLKIYNRGISGNKVPQLMERWQEDCLAIKPDILSILIGINDYWHKRNGNYQGSPEEFYEQYIELIESTKAELPNLQLIIGEPFALKDVKAVDESWFPELERYQKATERVAERFGATFIPYQKIFTKALATAPGSYWTTDGIHTTLAGSELMAEAWVKAVK